jgi:ABC-2 type transport system permease protein
MVATLVRLRFLVLKNTLSRSPWQIVAVVIGALYGLGLLFGIVAGLVALSFAPLEVTTQVLIIAGSVLVLGWVVIPLVFSGIEQTLEPARLVQFPIPLPKLLLGLGLSGILGVPGLVTTVAALAITISWIRYPAAAIAAAVCGLVGAVTCVLLSRAVAALGSGLASKRRFREVSGTIVLIPLILAGPIIIGVTGGLSSLDSDTFPRVARVLGWTPLGAPWAVPADIAVGDWLPALAKFVIALAFLAIVIVVWYRAFASALVNPPQQANKLRGAGKIGLFGVLPATPRGAVMARSLTYWVRDPRYLRQLISVPILFAVFWLVSSFNENYILLYLTGPFIAFSLALVIFADISYDGTAFATHLANGVRGVDDRWGRVAALLSFGLPATVLGAVGSVVISKEWPFLPAILGLSLGLLFSGMAVVSVSSARFVITVPAAGDSPFKSNAGGSIGQAGISFAVMGMLLLFTLPEIVLTIIAFVTGDIVFGYAALAVGVILGLVLVFVGIRVGGRTLDRTGPDLLVKLKLLRNG